MAATSQSAPQPPAQQAAVLGGRVFLLVGPPASGKGTQGKRLAGKFGVVHLSTGDVFRDLAQRGTELGLQAKEFMDRGCFVPDEMVLSLVRDRLSQPDVKERGCLLDGFPRTADQAEALLKHVKVDGVFLLQVPEKTLIRRAVDRRVDAATGDIYHLKYVPPPAEVGSRLVRRDRDDEHSLRQRIEVFKGQSRRVLPYFSGQVWKVDATLEPDDVFHSIVRILEGPLGRGGKGQEAEAAPPAAEHSCAICFEEAADFLVVPCGHQCGCEECLTAVQLHSGRCPICRTSVQGIQRVFRCGRGSGEEAASAAVPGTGMGATTHPDLQDKLDKQVDVADKDEDKWSEDGGGNQDQQEAASLVIAPCADVPPGGGDVEVMVSVQVPDASVRTPVDICCVIDVSGSMGSMATFETEDGQVKSDGLTVLDIVKHATKTVLKALQEGDRLALVAFGGAATTVVSLTEMTAAGQDAALAALETLSPSGQTNIWGGILAAMDALRAGGTAPGALNTGRQRAILLLTDGQPNVCPPRGHLAELRDYKDTHPGFAFQLNTFGFGYSLDSALLLDLAAEGDGTYAFIPDAVIVGTTFVNSVANVLSMLSQSATVNLMPRGGAELLGPAFGAFPELNESWGRAVKLGPLQHGQSRELVVRLRIPPISAEAPAGSVPYLEVIMECPRAAGSSGRVCAAAAGRQASTDAVVARCLADTVSTGYQAIAAAEQSQGKEAGDHVAKLRDRVAAALAETPRGTSAGPDGRLVALLADVAGRMSKALKGKERFNRWGKHYLRALVRSHQLQVCTNFMDPGLQAYGGALFRSLRETGDSIFLSLPPPKAATRQVVASHAGAGQCIASPPSPNMNTYYAGAGGGCFAPSSTVQLVAATVWTCDGLQVEEKQVPLDRVRAGDQLRVADGGLARVRCVARIERKVGKSLVALPGGVKITPRHPVRINGKWRLPHDLPGALLVASAAGCVYNVVLDRCHVLLVDGVECATWGHGLEGDAISHAFFGTDRVVEALAALEGWEQGRVLVQGCLRDAAGAVVGFWGPGKRP